MCFIAVIAFYGLRTYNNAQAVINSQQEFLTNLRSVKNKVTNGADGQAVKSVVIGNGDNNYTIVEVPPPSLVATLVKLPAGVTISISGSTPIGICFSNNLLSGFSAQAKCASTADGSSACISGSGYICNGTTASAPALGYLDVTFTNGTTTRVVRVEGLAMLINRVYANP